MKGVFSIWLIGCLVLLGITAVTLERMPSPVVPTSQVGLLLQIGVAHYHPPPGMFSVVIVSSTGFLALGMHGEIIGNIDTVRDGLTGEPSSTERSVAVGILDILEMQQRRAKP